MTDTVIHEGVLEMDPVDQGKGFQGTWLLLDDGGRLLLSYRPMEAYFAFVERRVVVHGQQFLPPPDVQHIWADHLSVKSMKLAPGQGPHEPTPPALPAPPLVEDRDALDQRIGRWAQVLGTLRLTEATSPAEAHPAVLVLADGAVVPVHSLASQAVADARRLAGRLVTILGRIGAQSGENGPRVEHAFAVCPGVADRCGMD